MKLDDRRSEEIAFDRFPSPAMAPATAVLRQGDEPIAFDGLGVGEQRAVGRPDPLDDADSAQNRLPAALLVSRPSGPISR
jgi:hypothetical protein